jgi:CHRD domain
MLIAVPSFTSRAIAAFLATVGWTVASQADPVSVRVPLSGMEEVPPVQTAGSGVAEFVYDPETRTVKWVVTYNGLSGPATMAHFHGPATQGTKGPVVVWLSKQGSPADSPLTGQTILTPEQAVQFAAGQLYVNVHTQANPGGEIRGQAILPKN